MLISENIPLDVWTVLHEMHKRQELPWNNGRINDYRQFNTLNKLFEIINSGIPKEDFMYQGDLYRIHTSYGTLSEYIDPSKERLVGKVYDDGSCRVLPITEYTNSVVAFSKSPDFTRPVFYKVYATEPAVIIHANTGHQYGIDVNALYQRFGCRNERMEEELEVLFPITKEAVIKEYRCTPNRFNYYMRKAGA